MKKRILIPLAFITLLLLLISPIAAIVNATPYDAQSQKANKQWGTLNNQSQANQDLNKSQKDSLKNKIIVVDPGHGGSDTGAIGPSNIAEKNVTLAISRDLNQLLSDAGAKVIMTRTSDRDVANNGVSDIDELQARVDIANQAHADLFISIHADSVTEDGSGTATYFYPGSNNSLARFVQNGMVGQLKLYDRGFQPNDYYVLKYANMPSILTEAAFISNPTEEKLLMNRDFDKKVAVGIYNGIKRFYLAQ